MDNYLINGPQGTSVNIASWTLADPGPDFGSKDLLQAQYAENPFADGGVLAYEAVGVRRMTFPLLVPSGGGVALSAAQIQGLLRQVARPGATLDIQLDGVASAEAVRFDVLAGRLEDEYRIPLWRGAGNRVPYRLALDVAPYGYLPTWILLASAASVGMPGSLAIPQPSVLGDVPGFVELMVAPTTATYYCASGVAFTDFLAWSLSARASFQAFWPAASALTILPGGTTFGDAFAPASQCYRWFKGASGGGASTFGVQPFAIWAIPPSLEPAYRGRFHLYAYARLAGVYAAGGSQWTLPWHVTGDVVRGLGATAATGMVALASAAPVATLPLAVGSFNIGVGSYGASPAFSLLDLGEVTIPPAGSGVNQQAAIRLWLRSGFNSSAVASTLVATHTVDVGGIYLQPIDGAAGIVPRGLTQPSIGLIDAGMLQAGFYANAYTRELSLEYVPSSTVASRVPWNSAAAYYRGPLPRLGASTLQLDLIAAAQLVKTASLIASNMPPVRTQPDFAMASVRYRPRFQFLKGI